MNAERWQRIENLLQSALERKPEERAAFLQQACAGDEAVRKEVESLLASNEHADSFLKSPAVQDAAPLLAGDKTNSMLGQRIGSYQIISQLGAGGMGEVYLAQDSRLGRKVAIKLLPPFFTKDEQRLRRFQQEARAASALNHPNIITIFDIGHVDDTHFIATEYIAGETLRSAMSKRNMRLSDALEVAIQTGNALAAAHEAGIVHRDIKPENIMLRPDGYVKVLDFGLAKLTERQITIGTQADTIARVDTDPGTVMGTASYMSPEQARGRDVDPRSDIFSLGVVLYEMVAGRVPFAGESPSDVIGAILEKEPPPLARYDPEAPSQLQWIVSKALRKDRDERYQTGRELLGDLKDLKQELDHQARLDRGASQESREAGIKTSGLHSPADLTSGSLAQTADGTARTTSSAEIILSEIKRHKTVVAFTLMALFILVGALALGLYKLAGRNKPIKPAPAINLTRLTTGGKVGKEGISGAGAISPDGKYVAFATFEAGKQSLWLRQVSTNSLQRILGPIDASDLATTYSPDGEFIYYRAVDKNNPQGALYQLPVLGGTPRKLLSTILGAVSFSPDGKQFCFVRHENGQEEAYALMIANSDGSGQQMIAERKGNNYFSEHPAWSPDGKVIACGAGFHSNSDSYSDTIVEVSVINGAERLLTSQSWKDLFRILWLKDGSGLIVSASEHRMAYLPQAQIWYLSYPDGVARRITNDLNTYGQATLGLTSDSSTILTAQSDTSMQIWVTRPNEDASLAKQISNGKVDGFNGLAWTPDGKIAYVTQSGETSDIWMMNSDGTENKQLTTDAFLEYSPTMTSDNRYIVFSSERTAPPHLWRMHTDGSDPKQLTEGSDADFDPDCSPDGRWIVFIRASSGRGRVWKVSIDGGTPVQMSDTASGLPVFSPDGKLIAYGYLDEKANNRPALAIIPAEGGQPIKTFDLPRFFKVTAGLKWTPDGRAVTYVDSREGVNNIWSQPLDGGSPKQLTNFKSEFIIKYAWSRDGKLALSRGHDTADVVLIRNFR